MRGQRRRRVATALLLAALLCVASFSACESSDLPDPAATPTLSAQLVLVDDASDQESEPPVLPLSWPPFVATYETNIRPLSINGVRQVGREVRRIEWNSTYDWKVTVLSSPNLGGNDATGTYWEQRGNVYSHYDTWDREPEVETQVLSEHHYFLPPSGVFWPHLYSNDNFDARTDGELVILNVEYCDGPLTSCESSGTGAALLQGRRFEESPAVLSDDTNRIPLESGHLRVTKLHTNPPPTPTPTARPRRRPVPLPSWSLPGQAVCPWWVLALIIAGVVAALAALIAFIRHRR